MTAFVLIILLALIVVFGVDVRQKRRAVLEQFHQHLHLPAYDQSDQDASMG